MDDANIFNHMCFDIEYYFSMYFVSFLNITC